MARQVPQTGEPFAEDTGDGPAVRGFLHRAEKDGGDGWVVTHGAGADCGSPLLVSLAETFARAGVSVLRCDLPFRQARPHGSPHPAGAAQDRAGLLSAVAALRRFVVGRIFLGGHSYGGRQASMLAAEQRGAADGLVLLSYPLHPPNNPGKVRTAHLPDLHSPALFIHGTKDPFGTPAEMEDAIKLIPAPTRLVFIEGAGHGLIPAKVSKARTDEAAARILSEFTTFFDRS